MSLNIEEFVRSGLGLDLGYNAERRVYTADVFNLKIVAAERDIPGCESCNPGAHAPYEDYWLGEGQSAVGMTEAIEAALRDMQEKRAEREAEA